MKFELLPNEILLECFEYLNTFDIFHSFDQLNDRLNHLIRHIPLCINLEDVNKSILDEFCTKMLVDPQIKNQVYALNLPLAFSPYDACLPTRSFLSFFSPEEFINVQKFKLSMPVEALIRGGYTSQLELVNTPFSKLQTLSTPYLRWIKHDKSFERTASLITNLILYSCDLNDFYYLSEHAPMLKYLRIKLINCGVYKFYKNPNGDKYSLHLNQLIIDDFENSFDDFEIFVKQTPNLKSLTISAFNRSDMADANRWKQLITSSLPYLDIFKFFYSFYSDDNSIIVKFKEFQTDFWQKQHHWFTEYAMAENVGFIYTIPYLSNAYKLLPNTKRYCNNLRNNINTFMNLTNLILYRESLTINCEYYFSNVTSLTLVSSNNHCLTRKHIKYLKNIVNLFNLKHLDISNYDATRSSILLKILKAAPQLFSLSIEWHQLRSFFNNSELCKYLNQMIKRLHIDGRSNFNAQVYLDNNRLYRLVNNLVNDPFEVQQFCKIFSNIEHLQCKNSHAKELLLLLDHLPKLSTLHVQWVTEEKLKNYLSQFKNKVRKLNVQYNINIEIFDTFDYKVSDVLEAAYGAYYVDIRMWFGNKMS